MTNTPKLQGKMREKGFSLATLADAIGLSSTGLFNKVHNHKEFLISEVQAITSELNLSDEEVQEIFFGKKVE